MLGRQIDQSETTRRKICGHDRQHGVRVCWGYKHGQASAIGICDHLPGKIENSKSHFRQLGEDRSLRPANFENDDVWAFEDNGRKNWRDHPWN